MEQEDLWLLDIIREIEENRQIQRGYQPDPFRTDPFRQEEFPTYSTRQTHDTWHTGRNLFDQDAYNFNEGLYRHWSQVEVATNPTRWRPSTIENHREAFNREIEDLYSDYMRRAEGLYFDELIDAEWNPNRAISKEEKPPAAADLPLL